MKLSADDVINFFGNGFIMAGEGKIINLAQEENLVAFEDGVVDGFIVCGRVELEFVGRKDGVDVRFPEVTGFGVTL